MPVGSATFDDAPRRFRADHPEDKFSGASGVLFEQAMAQTRMAICLCDPHAEDTPIVFANRAFRALTGYDEEEIIGNNCRFLQGPDTDPKQVEKIRHALATEDVLVVELLNYRKDGSSFWNALHLGPVYDNDGNLMYFFGSQWDVSDVRAARAEEHHAKMMARELSHRMKNMFAVISGIVNITGRMRGIEKESAEINGRIQALGRAYETTLDEASSGSIEIGQAIRAILSPYGADEDRLIFLGNGARVPFQTVSVVGLVLHELAANATKFGAWSDDNGRVEVDWKRGEVDDSAALIIEWQEVGGPQVSEPENDEGTGTAIVNRMLRLAQGQIDREWAKDGLRVTISVPLGSMA
ncbi:PAS domain-containing protein [Altererythrobacter endophyticus]|uniref:histidine kinase n=2 Tax=Altericroceibacterium endophyticum TaxID=1808508 RepID=A0A6I4T9K9_9SPHN|nr:PAS domain-containing protein [Altericroceibacterium endophyticum]MXO66972.1 PAS domain-containing protein [Altericroceibacterium endophyticum]